MTTKKSLSFFFSIFVTKSRFVILQPRSSCDFVRYDDPDKHARTKETDRLRGPHKQQQRAAAAYPMQMDTHRARDIRTYVYSTVHTLCERV